MSAKYGWAPGERERLVPGHESPGRVLEAPAGSSFSRRDLAREQALERRSDDVMVVIDFEQGE